MWQLRNTPQRVDYRSLYDGMSWLFTIKLHHGGEFTRFPDVKYIDGTISFVDMVDIEEFSVHELDSMMKGLGYSTPPVIYFHFRIPDDDMHFGLRALGNDEDMRNLAQYVNDNKLICVYTEHGMTKLLTYFMSPNGPRKVIIEEITEPEEVDQSPLLMMQICLKDPTSPVFGVEVDGIHLIENNPKAIIVSPEFNRKRIWQQDNQHSSCTRKLNLNNEPKELLDYMDQPSLLL